jgi:heme/copper-type cytochrome/quinol oxidase subunit 2
MLIPQYSLRWLLAATTIAAVVFSVVAMGVHGSHWALAASAGILALVILAVVHVMLFTLIWSISAARQHRQSGGTPFRKHA